MLTGILGPKTQGCVDINDGDFHVHVCDAQPGGVVRADRQTDWSSLGNCDVPRYPGSLATWKLGDTVTLVPFDTAGGYPQCCVLAEYADVDAYVDAVIREDDPYADLPKVQGLAGGYVPHDDTSPRATFQWKGTALWLTWTCVCDTACKVEGAEFAYSVACPRCRACYTVSDAVPVTRLPAPPASSDTE